MSEFVSDIGRCPIIETDDDVTGVLESSGAFGGGYKPRDFSRHPFGSVATPFSLPLIPRSQWDERIQIAEQSKSRIPDICDAAGLKVKNQQQTNFCWANAPVHCLEIIRVVQQQTHVELSPASVACAINGFRNEGGWGTEALKYLVDYGVVPSEKWPSNAIDRKYDTPANNVTRAKFRVVEWWDLQPGNFDQLATCLLLNIPVAIGLNWWGHEVTAVALVKLGSNKYGVMIDNSWGTDWGDNGRSVLSESKATPDDAVAPRTVVVS